MALEADPGVRRQVASLRGPDKLPQGVPLRRRRGVARRQDEPGDNRRLATAPGQGHKHHFGGGRLLAGLGQQDQAPLPGVPRGSLSPGGPQREARRAVLSATLSGGHPRAIHGPTPARNPATEQLRPDRAQNRRGQQDQRRDPP